MGQQVPKGQEVDLAVQTGGQEVDQGVLIGQEVDHRLHRGQEVGQEVHKGQEVDQAALERGPEVDREVLGDGQRVGVLTGQGQLLLE